MKSKLFLMVLSICLFFCISNLHAMECQIINEEGKAINSATGGELVYFKSIYAYSKSKKMAWNLMVTPPTVDSTNYKTSMKHNGYFFHEASLENKSHLIPIAIPKDSFIEGNATFKYTLTSNGNCYVYLNIDQDSEPPTASTLTATAVSTSRIDLSWTACTDNKGVSGYKIHSSNGTPLRTVSVTSTYFDNLTPDTQYCYTVTAHDAVGNESVHSNTACATTLSEDTTALSIPTLTATATSSSRIDLSWNASAENVGIAGYKIYSDSGSYLASGNGTSHYFASLNPNTQYCYKVTAYDAIGNESGFSNTACATTPEPTPEPDPEPTECCPKGENVLLCKDYETESPLLTIQCNEKGYWYLSVKDADSNWKVPLWIKLPLPDLSCCPIEKTGITPDQCAGTKACQVYYAQPTDWTLYSTEDGWYVGNTRTTYSYKVIR